MNVLSRAPGLINLYIYIEREIESENSLLGNEQKQKQQQKQDSVVGSMRKKMGR